MKKALFLAFLVVACSIYKAHSEPTCYDGTLVYASGHPKAGAERNALCTPDPSKCNEHVFCRSNVPMNWFSAWTWCKSQGRRLAHWKVMCPEIPAKINKINGACPNLNLISAATIRLWSSYGLGDSSALDVTPASGIVGNGYYGSSNYAATHYALCE